MAATTNPDCHVKRTMTTILSGRDGYFTSPVPISHGRCHSTLARSDHKTIGADQSLGLPASHLWLLLSQEGARLHVVVRAFSLIALVALGMPGLACSESSLPIQVASGGQAGNNGDSSMVDGAGGRPLTEAGRHAKFRVIDPVKDHALRSGENPMAFDRSTTVTRFSSDASIVVGVSEFQPLGDANHNEGREALRWTETSGVVGLGFAPGLDTTDPRSLLSTPYCVSLDGSTVAGASGDSSTPFSDVFLWTEALGMTNLGQVAGATSIELMSASSDCRVLAGTVADDQSHLFEAVRWSSASGWQRLGSLPGDSGSEAAYVSADGAIVVGISETGSSRQGYRWTESTGMGSLGQLPGTQSCYPRGATRDARVVVGECSTGTASQTFRWTEATGLVSLGSVPGSNESSIGAVSADGTVVVGDFRDANSKPQAFRWTQATGMVALGLLAGYPQTSLSQASQAMNADGTVLVGDAIDVGN